MISIGEHLRTAREEKGFSFDQVVHDTNISREYIHALEEDNFDFFPAEAYLIGFLRNYSEYLGLDPSKMVGIYKNFKISEEPVPMDLLLGKKKSAPEKKEKKVKEENFEGRGRKFPKWLFAVIVTVLVLGGVGVVFLPSLLNLDMGGNQEEPVTEEVKEEQKGPKEFFLTEETLDITVSDGDKINVSTGSKMISFSANISDEKKSLIYQDIENILKEMNLNKDDEQVILIEEKQGEYIFYIKEISATSVTLIAQKVNVDETLDNSAVVVDSTDSGSTPSAERIAEKIVYYYRSLS